MLSQNSAKDWFDKIIQNHKTGTCKQRVLGLRGIFDSVLLEMFPNISSQGFYHDAIEMIFDNKNNPNKSNANLQKEFHLLREYLNCVQHSKIEPDEKGYLLTIKRLSRLIKHCSGLPIPEKLSALYSKNNDPRESSKNPKVIVPTEPLLERNKDNTQSSLLVLINKESLTERTLEKLNQGIAALRNLISGIENFWIYSFDKENAKITNAFNRHSSSFVTTSTELEHIFKPLINIKSHNNLGVDRNLFVVYITEENSTDLKSLQGIKDFFKAPKLIFYSVGVKSLSISHHKQQILDNLVAIDKIAPFFEWISEFIKANNQ